MYRSLDFQKQGRNPQNKTNEKKQLNFTIANI